MRKKILSVVLAAAVAGVLIPFTGSPEAYAADEVEKVTLRICNWEEYIDEGDWDDDEVIDLDSGDIFGEYNMIDEFEEWYLENYGVEVTVEYSTFGVPEDLYNMLTLGDVYDLICPSEYMFMKLMAEDALMPLSDEFFDTSNEYNYYINNVSPYIQEIFDSHEINGEAWSEYAAGYMWGVTGIVYNPEYVTYEEASTWSILTNEKFKNQITIKDSVREAYFPALAVLKSDLLTSEEFINDPDYKTNLEEEMNETTDELIDEAGAWLQEVKQNVYSFETDAGKADMITGKVVANAQWSGDAVYTLDQADEDDCYLEFAMPQEASNIYFDGWVMLKSGVEGDSAKQQAAEAFINYVSRPDNAIRNMYYIGYTSVIAGNEDDSRIFEYAEWNFSAEDDEEETIDYSIGYFFGSDSEDEDYIIEAPENAVRRQLFSQYPDEESIERTSIMTYFDADTQAEVNNMWVQVRCYKLSDIPIGCFIAAAAIIVFFLALLIRTKRKKKKTY